MSKKSAAFVQQNIFFTFILGLLLATIVLVLGSSVPLRDTKLQTINTTTPADAATLAGPLVEWQGGSWFLLGANMAWRSWGNDWGDAGTGVANTTVYNELSGKLRDLRANGIPNVRWWLFENRDDRPMYQFTKDSSGMPTGLTEQFYRDFDAAVRLAEEHDIYYHFTLFAGLSNPPQNWIDNAAGRTKLADALTPLFRRHGTNPHVMSWDVWNEPEYISGVGSCETCGLPADKEDWMKKTAIEIADRVHKNSHAYVNVGSYKLKWIDMWEDTGAVDFHQPHFYYHFGDHNESFRCAVCHNYNTLKTKYGITKPVVIGEWDARPEYTGTQDTYATLNKFLELGYAGAWGWSMYPQSTADRFSIDYADMKRFATENADIVGPKRRTTGAPTSTPRPTTQPTTPTPTLSPTPTPIVTLAPSLTPSQGYSLLVEGMSSQYQSSQNLTGTFVAQSNTSGNYLVDFEIYNTAGIKVSQTFWDNQSFTAGQPKRFTLNVSLGGLPDGNYTIKGGIFQPGWGTLLHWNGNIRSFQIGNTVNPADRSDINRNGMVDVFDLGILTGHYNKQVSQFPSDPTVSNADINQDGMVNIFDLGILSSNYGRTL